MALVPVQGADFVRLVVVDLGQGQPADSRGGRLRNASISVLDLREALAALVGLVDQPLAVVADVDVEVVEVFEDGLLAVLDGGGQLGEEQSGDGGVLVADVRALSGSRATPRRRTGSWRAPPPRSGGRST